MNVKFTCYPSYAMNSLILVYYCGKNEILDLMQLRFKQKRKEVNDPIVPRHELCL